jgi:hypothetical protein
MANIKQVFFAFILHLAFWIATSKSVLFLPIHPFLSRHLTQRFSTLMVLRPTKRLTQTFYPSPPVEKHCCKLLKKPVLFLAIKYWAFLGNLETTQKCCLCLLLMIHYICLFSIYRVVVNLLLTITMAEVFTIIISKKNNNNKNVFNS